MLVQIKKVKSEERVLGQYPACIYIAAQSRTAGRTEKPLCSSAAPYHGSQQLLVCVTFACL